MIQYNILRNPTRTLEEAAKYQFYKNIMDEETFNTLNKIYPKYSVWVIDKYLKLSDTTLSKKDAEEWIRPLLETYEKISKQGFFKSELCPPEFKKFQDIQNIGSLETLHFLIKNRWVRDFIDQQTYKNYKKEALYVVAYTDENWTIIRPDNFLACILLGGGDFGDGTQTKWCVSTKSQSSEINFERYYTPVGDEEHCPMIFIQNNKTKERWLVGGSDDLINDDEDDELDEKDTKKLLDSLPQEAIQKTDAITNGTFSELMTGDIGRINCANCGDRVNKENTSEVEGETWCESCAQDLSVCSECETYVKDDSLIRTDAGRELCEKCGKWLETCDQCGNKIDSQENMSRYKSAGWCDSSGTCYCSNCWEDHTICDECDNFTDNPERGDDGNYYCPDCIDDHKEEPEEEEEEENILETSKKVFRFKRIK